MAPKATDYIVKDIGLADWGRKELDMAETEMPGHVEFLAAPVGEPDVLDDVVV